MKLSDEACDCNALAVYGSLQPGAPNEHVLSELAGTWTQGFVRGNLEHSGWGSEVGYPGIRLSDAGDQVTVQLFRSGSLSKSWHELDAFEGHEYLRQHCTVETAEGPVTACIYTLAE